MLDRHEILVVVRKMCGHSAAIVDMAGASVIFAHQVLICMVRKLIPQQCTKPSKELQNHKFELF